MNTVLKRLDFYMPLFEICRAFRNEEPMIFLDSSLTGELGQYSILGRNPYLIFRETNGICEREDRRGSGSRKELVPCPIEEALDDYLRENREENPGHLPLLSGALGYFTYDYGRKFERIESRHGQVVSMPDALFVFYDNLILEDCRDHVLYVTGCGNLGTAEESVDRIEKEILGLYQKRSGGPGDSASKDACSEGPQKQRVCSSDPMIPKHTGLAPFTADFSEEEYMQAVRKMIEYIYEGDIYITNMTQQLQIKSDKNPFDVFAYLRTWNPSPFGAYLNLGDVQIASASPERFLRLKNRQIETRPIKGTRKRGSTPKEDDNLRAELQNSEKDRSELLMIVDLERNDLNHVCIPGSVQVTEHFSIEAYATVFHLVSTIVGTTEEDFSLKELLQAAFPGGSITGAPKIRAMELIDELERSRRGLYTGSIGYLSLDGSLDLNIVIRTAVCQDGTYHLGVGGGITCESDPAFEYEETLQKAKAVLEAIYEDTDR